MTERVTMANIVEDNVGSDLVGFRPFTKVNEVFPRDGKDGVAGSQELGSQRIF